MKSANSPTNSFFTQKIKTKYFFFLPQNLDIENLT